MSEGLLSKSVCQEFHIFKPFSAGDHGVTTSQEQTLEFVASTRTTQNVPVRGISFLSSNPVFFNQGSAEPLGSLKIFLGSANYLKVSLD
jgi:hypothetical protein